MLNDGFPLIRSDDTQPGRKTLAKIPQKRREAGTAGAVPAHFDDAADCENDEPLPLWVLRITQPALRQLLDFLLAREPEAAGLLLGPTNDESLVTHFVPDLTGRGTPASFELGTTELNRVLQHMKPASINCKGLAHSHPPGFMTPSHGDLSYLQRLFGLAANATACQFYLPIVCGGRLYPYIYAQGRVWCADLVLV